MSDEEDHSREFEMRDGVVPTFDNRADLIDYIEKLATEDHDYGTAVYAMSMAATASFNYMARALGVTGFQASCADMDILKRTRGLKGPFMIVKLEDALYPQYDLVEKVQKALDDSAPWLKEQAQALLDKERDPEMPPPHPDVLAHWKHLAGVA